MGTTSYHHSPGILHLQAISGPPLAPLAIPSGKPAVIGRQATTADIVLAGDLSVSRNHATVFSRGGTWLICDIGSKHGTYLNGVRIPPHELAPIRDGDFIRIGPWTFHVGGRPVTSPRLLTTNDDIQSSANRVRRLPDHEFSLKVRERLELLIDAAGTIAASSTIEGLAHAALDAVIGATPYPRAAFIRRVHSGEFDAQSRVEVIASRIQNMPDSPPGEFDSFSLTVLRAADDGKVVVLDGGPGEIPPGQSLIDLRIQHALCAPILVDGVPCAYLYLDARKHESAAGVPLSGSSADDAPAFCVAIARVCGLAMAKLNRAALDIRRQELEKDLQAARAAQNMLMPAAQGTLGPFDYAVRSCPGRLVAGDLFHASVLPDGRVAVMIGDVAGKGIGAGILMAGTQAHLAASLTHHADPARAVQEANRFVSIHGEPGRIVSLLLAIIDPASGEMTFVDAGHGYWLVRTPGSLPRRVPCQGGPPIGTERDTAYVNEHVPFGPGSSLIAFSDGLAEQPGPDGTRFGIERVCEVCKRADDPDRIVDALLTELRTFAGGGHLDDDVTIAALRRADS
ncbi:MAG: SpoIIE family protein phosphatase [Phycisphaeraceae bacterium]|nr:SpoIIE family protein phosphatase [Phycisphaerae bacterium]MBX3391977.1 SpoIIE family protein phosphatase [Phycisphaeraceae bacterium]